MASEENSVKTFIINGESIAVPRKKKLSSILLLIGFVIAICVLLYPTFTDHLSNIFQAMSIGGYTGDYAALSDEERARLKEEAYEYNIKIYEGQQKTPFAYEGEKYEDALYDSILKVSDENNMMCYVEIPKIGVYLPVVHGTKSDDLNSQIGHMHGSSVPIGGKNSHAILAGHTGLRSYSLFTDLDKMEKGDQFYIHVLDEIHVYTVDSIKVVLPKDCNQYLQIIPDKDYITLYTCTPYGINSHRLLVRGERTGDLQYEGQDGDMMDVNSHKWKEIIICILLLLIPLSILSIGLYRIINKEKIMAKKIAKVKDS